MGRNTFCSAASTTFWKSVGLRVSAGRPALTLTQCCPNLVSLGGVPCNNNISYDFFTRLAGNPKHHLVYIDIVFYIASEDSHSSVRAESKEQLAFIVATAERAKPRSIPWAEQLWLALESAAEAFDCVVSPLGLGSGRLGMGTEVRSLIFVAW